VRSIFDQYKSPENRLTHALACCLHEDHSLLVDFVRGYVGCQPPAPGKLEIIEQQLPGDPHSPGNPELSPDEKGKRGLPDACILDSESWCLIIENKVMAGLTREQIEGHLRSVGRRHPGKIEMLVLTAAEADQTAFEGLDVRFKLWSSVYTWARGCKSPWAAKLARYLEAAEVRMSQDRYLGDVTLTEFSGVPFGKKEPYNYFDAKRVLKVAMEALRQRKDLLEQLGIDPAAPGKAAIKGRSAGTVWDLIRLRTGEQRGLFTDHPHLTLAIGEERALALLILPNGMKRHYWKRLVAKGKQGFRELVLRCAVGMKEGLSSAPGFVPWLEVVQRHFPHLGSPAVLDGLLQFDLRTALTGTDFAWPSKVKPQGQWLDHAFELFERKRSNIQMAIGAKFPYDECEAVSKREALDFFAAAWIACKPILEVVLGKP
jgi:hypothetical protein